MSKVATRKIDGKTYHFASSWTNKRDAKEQARMERAWFGRPARVVKAPKGYARKYNAKYILYVRGKRKRRKRR